MHGSLFDFLYKPRKAAPVELSHDSKAATGYEMRSTNVSRQSEFGVGARPMSGTHNPIGGLHARDSESKDDARDSNGQRASNFSVHTVDSYNGGGGSVAEGSMRSSAGERQSTMSMSTLASKTSKAFGASLSTLISTTNSILGRAQVEEAANGPALHSSAYFVSLRQRVRMMRDAVNAIAFLHSKGYMHCDIKSLNFLVTEVRLFCKSLC